MAQANFHSTRTHTIKYKMLHQQLAKQLSELGISPEEVPDKDLWSRFLAMVSQAYSQRAAEQDRLQALLANLADAIITFDENGRIEWFNPAAEQMFGYTAVEIGGQYLEVLLPDPRRVQIEEDALALSTEKSDGRADIISIHNEISGQRKNGDIFPLSFTISQMTVQGERQFIGIAHDITQQKQAEQEILAAKDEAEKANRIKSQFLANTSHEIRTPLNAIIGLTSLLLDTDLNVEQRAFVKTTQQSSHTLLAILNDILDLSKIEAGKLEIASRPFHLQTCILEVVNLLKPMAAQKRLPLETEMTQTMPQVFMGDEHRLRQILLNLLSNAIKFTQEGKVVIRLTGEFQSSTIYEIHIAIQDTGVGLPGDYKKWLFAAFEQGNIQHTHMLDGAGLGLAITKRLVDLMNGYINVETVENEGSTFQISLPLPLSKEPVAENTSGRVKAFDADMAKSHPLRILIAEDNHTNQKVMVWMLEHLGYEPDIVANGREALAALRKKPYDLILMDMQMPELDGLAATQKIRQMNSLKKQPWIVAVTADNHFLTREKRENHHLNDYLVKPVQAEALITTLCLCPPGEETPPHLELEAAPAPNVPVSESNSIDFALLAKIVDYDEKRLAELISISLVEIEDLWSQLETALAKADYEAIRQTAHALKGCCATLAMPSLVEVFGTIESLALAQTDLPQINEKTMLAKREYPQLIKEIKTYIF